MLPGVKPYPVALTRIRSERGFTTVSALADFLGWDSQLCSRIEKGARDLTLQEAIYIANTLGIGIEELMEDPNVIQKIPAKNSIADHLQELVRQLPSHYAAPLYALLSGLVKTDGDNSS